MAAKVDEITKVKESEGTESPLEAVPKMDRDSRLRTTSTPSLLQPFPHLVREAELQRLLADEKARCEQHKTNYQTLKNEHIRLQEEFLSLQMELKTHFEEMKFLKENYQDTLDAMEQTVADKNKEIEDLKHQLNFGKPEVIKQKLKEEVEKPLKEKCLKLREEIDHCQDEFSALRYENAMLKTQMEYAKREYQNNLEQLKLLSAKEIESLKEMIEEIQAKQSSGRSQEAKQLIILEEENNKLMQKIKSLQADVEELEAEKKKVKSDGRAQAMHQNELTAKLWSLETELATVKAQRDSFESELASNQQTVTSLRADLKELKDKEMKLSNIIEDQEQRMKKELANAKLSALSEKSAIERERDELLVELKSVKLDLESEHSAVLKLEQTLETRDKEAQAKLQVLRQQEWEKQKRLESEMQHLETKLKEAEKNAKETETKYANQLYEIKEELQRTSNSKLSVERELVIVRAQLEGLHSSKAEILGVQKQNSLLQEDLQRLKNIITEMTVMQKELQREREQQQETLAKLQKTLDDANSELSRERESKENALLQQQLNHSQEKHQYQSRIDELENKMRNANLQFSKDVEELKNKQKQYARLITKLRNRLELTNARQQELEIENEALQKRVPQEVFADLKKQLRDLQRRHMEFNQLVGVASIPSLSQEDLGYFNVTPYTAVKSTIPYPVDMRNVESTVDNTQELQTLKERLEDLDRQQKLQMEKLTQFVDQLKIDEKQKEVGNGAAAASGSNNS